MRLSTGVVKSALFLKIGFKVSNKKSKIRLYLRVMSQIKGFYSMRLLNSREYRRLGFILVFFLCFSCTFTPEAEFINNIIPPEPIVFSIEVNSPEFTDPHYLLGATQFNFTLKDLTKPLVGYDVIIDGDSLAATESGANLGNNVSFVIYPYNLSEGKHTVTLRLRIATQSNSLAEKLGFEYHLAEPKFDIILDRKIPTLNTPLVADYEFGYLTLRWPSINQQNFKYIIKRIPVSGFGQGDTTFYNPEVNSFIDNAYVGGGVTYKLIASGLGFEQHELGSVYFTTPPMDLNLIQDQNRVVRLFWDNVKINTVNTFLELGYTSGPRFPLAPSGNEVIDTLLLGEDKNYWITVRRDGNLEQFHRNILRIQSTKNIKEYESFVMMPQNNKLLLNTGLGIYRYALPSLILEDSLMAFELGFQRISSLVTNAIESKAMVVGDGSSLSGFDPLNFDDRRSAFGFFTAVRKVTGNSDEISHLWLGNLSKNDFLPLLLRQNNKNIALLFNINDGQVYWNSPPTDAPDFRQPPLLSDDEQFLAYDVQNIALGVLLKKTGEAYNQVGFIKKGFKYFESARNELINVTMTDQYGPVSDGAITIYSMSASQVLNGELLPDRSTILPRTIGDESIKGIYYDQLSSTLYSRYMTGATSYLRLINIDDFNFYGEVISAFTYTGYTHMLSNHYQLTSRGFIEEVK